MRRISRISAKFTFIFAGLVAVTLLSTPALADRVLILSTGSSSLDGKVQTVLESYGHTVTIGNQFTDFTGAELAQQDVVILLPTLDSGDGNMPADGQSAIVNFVSEGGGLVTTEWTIWMSAYKSFQILKSALPVVSSETYSENRNPITYKELTEHPVINRDLPPSLTFNTDFFYGTETFFAPKPGATVFYTSAGGTGGAGLVGWQYRLGRVVQFSTLFGPNQLADSNAARLLVNAVSWAGNVPIVSGIDFAPGSVRVGSSFTVRFSGVNVDENTYLDIRFRAPGRSADEVALNWQEGPLLSHVVDRSAIYGRWTVTGVRAHRIRDDHTGNFNTTSATFDIVSAPLVTNISFEPPLVVAGNNLAGRFSGTDLTTATFFDVRFRAPGSTVDQIVLNWQQGALASHAVPVVTSPGNWTVTGVRAHENRDDHAGDFDSLLVNLAVAPSSCVITTSAGTVFGLDFGSSCAFLGIPYAAPPVGNLRWKPPQPAPPWSPLIFNAATPPSNCAALSATTGQPGGSEDCLKLNIWIPKAVSMAPVMVWLHTGAFLAASANFAGHDGRKMAEQTNTIVVAPNYRLGAFGFLAHDALTNEVPGYRSSGNYGLLDQRAALLWVKNNITVFGGDNNRITIAGQSAGAHSVSLHLISPGSAGLFHRAAMQSGYASIQWQTREEAESRGNSFASALGCTDPSQVLSCLRTKSRDQILRALPVGREEFTETAGVRWGPVVDGLEIPDQPRILYERGAFHRVPVIIGANRDEGWVFVDRSFPTGLTAAQFEAAVQSEFGPSAPALLARYRLQDFASPKEALAQVTGDVEYICEAVRVARLIERTGNPVYLYSFEYVVDGLASNRVIHGLDTNFVFGNDFVAPNPGNHLLNANDLVLSASMKSYWARFAAAGDPNGPANDRGRWSPYDRRYLPQVETDKYLVLDSTIRENRGLRQQQCDFLESFYFRSVTGSVPASTP
jgi:para-nitrobenzyl esterase